MNLRLALLLTSLSPVFLSAQTPVSKLGSKQMEIEFNPDLRSIRAIRDLKNNRDYVGELKEPVPLYSILLGFGATGETLLGDTRGMKNLEKTGREGITITAADAKEVRWQAAQNGLELTFIHDFAEQGRATVTANLRYNSSGAAEWRLKVRNETSRPLAEIKFPQVNLGPLGANPQDDALVLPQMEGALTLNPTGRNIGWSGTYPGPQSVQFTYYYDQQGGLYLAAHDSKGGAKSLNWRSKNGRLTGVWTHRFSEIRTPETEIPYPVVMQMGGGHWQDGADLYKAWATQQPWTSKTIAERVAQGEIPKWLAEPQLFLNFNVKGKDYETAQSADAIFQKVQNYYGLPLVTCAFGWERYDEWIGPRYFPPNRGDDYYRELSARLAERNGHLHVMTSGFRWAVRRPTDKTRDARRQGKVTAETKQEYINYDGFDDFFQNGTSSATVTATGGFDFRVLWWIDVYMMCPGSQQARHLIGDAFHQLFDLGIAGVDLDQDLGCRAEPCWSLEHDHPPGFGAWQYEAMSSFLSEVRAKARPKHPDAFMAVEEPCEAYIQHLDIFHGRGFTDGNDFPVGKGQQSIPLYAYLYHEYNLGYAGWMDSGFSPFGNENAGFVRTFLFGMQPGIRSGKPLSEFDAPNSKMKNLSAMLRVFKQMPEFLLLGVMQRDPRVEGAPPVVPGPPEYGTAEATSKFFVEQWQQVQATAWKSPDGRSAIAVANVSDRPQQVLVDVSLLRRRGAKTIQEIRSEARTENSGAGSKIKVNLAPWECLGLVEEKP